jgi:hypothetical protein
LVTTTDSEVLCRLVRRWIGQGGKASLSNTTDADFLEFIIGKLRARIAANARTFLVKIKAHRGEPLNERADDLADEGKTLAKAGDSYPWTNRTTRLVYSYYDRTTHQWKKDTWSKTVRNTGRGVWRSTYWKIDYNKVSRNKQVVDRQGYSTPSDVWRKSICTLHCISLEFLVENIQNDTYFNIFTDGGYVGPHRASIGVYISNGNPNNVSRLPPRFKQNNKIA